MPGVVFLDHSGLTIEQSTTRFTGVPKNWAKNFGREIKMRDLNGKQVVLKLKARRAKTERYYRKANHEIEKTFRRQKANKYGSQGPASDIRIIDPTTGKQINTISVGLNK
jgi:hypothetical protein